MTNKLDRRQFIGQSAVTGAAAGLALSATASRAADSANEKVVVGVMGLSRGRSLSVSFAKRPNVEVKYVCDVDITRAGSGAKLVEGAGVKQPEAIADFRQILDDKSVDFVCVVSKYLAVER